MCDTHVELLRIFLQAQKTSLYPFDYSEYSIALG